MTTFTTFVSLTRLTAMLAAGTFLLTVADGASTMDGVVEVPAALNPDKLSIFRVVSAKGVQVYACTRNPAGATGWVLRGPDAKLFDPQNKPVGKHYAGPTWEGLDGGKVVGEMKTSLPAPVDKAVPWLMLDAKSHEGSGDFTRAQAIVRMETTGGTAPSDGCDEARAGQELRVPYTAIYVFLK
ncbi:MAG: DUF3455 domain-containing protein [Pseudolabrys sp.]